MPRTRWPNWQLDEVSELKEAVEVANRGDGCRGDAFELAERHQAGCACEEEEVGGCSDRHWQTERRVWGQAEGEHPPRPPQGCSGLCFATEVDAHTASCRLSCRSLRAFLLSPVACLRSESADSAGDSTVPGPRLLSVEEQLAFCKKSE